MERCPINYAGQWWCILGWMRTHINNKLRFVCKDIDEAYQRRHTRKLAVKEPLKAELLKLRAHVDRLQLDAGKSFALMPGFSKKKLLWPYGKPLYRFFSTWSGVWELVRAGWRLGVDFKFQLIPMEQPPAPKPNTLPIREEWYPTLNQYVKELDDFRRNAGKVGFLDRNNTFVTRKQANTNLREKNILDEMWARQRAQQNRERDETYAMHGQDQPVYEVYNPATRRYMRRQTYDNSTGIAPWEIRYPAGTPMQEPSLLGKRSGPDSVRGIDQLQPSAPTPHWSESYNRIDGRRGQTWYQGREQMPILNRRRLNYDGDEETKDEPRNPYTGRIIMLNDNNPSSTSETNANLYNYDVDEAN